MADRVYVFDTTLRDGEQSPGATMNLDEKIRMAKPVGNAGRGHHRGGVPHRQPGRFRGRAGHCPGRGDTVQVAGLCRAVTGDIDRCWEAVKEAKNPRIHTFLATSEIHMEHKLGKTAEEVIVMIDKAVRHASGYTDNVEFSAEDASRSDWDFLVRVTEVAIEAGAKVVNIPDTVGYTQPFEYHELIKYLMDNVKNAWTRPILSVHCHNDLGLRRGQLPGRRQGRCARQVECTVLGIGERAGNAALEDLVMAINTRKELYNVETGINTEQIYPSCRRLSQIIGMPIPPNKAIVGCQRLCPRVRRAPGRRAEKPADLRDHDPGIHRPDVQRHSYRQALRVPRGQEQGRGAGLQPGRRAGPGAVQGGQGFGRPQGADLRRGRGGIDPGVRVPAQGSSFRLVDMSVFSGAGAVPPHAATIMEFGAEGEAETRKTSNFGEGSIDAVFQSIYSLVGISPKLEFYSVNAVTEGSDALAGVSVRISYDGVKAVGRANDGDVVKASALAMVNALNRLEKAKEEK